MRMHVTLVASVQIDNTHIKGTLWTLLQKLSENTFDEAEGGYKHNTGDNWIQSGYITQGKKLELTVCASGQPAEPKSCCWCWINPHLPAPVPPWWIAQWGRARWSCGNPHCTHSGQEVGRCRWASREATAPWCTRPSRASAPGTWWQSWRVRCPERDVSLQHQTQTQRDVRG